MSKSRAPKKGEDAQFAGAGSAVLYCLFPVDRKEHAEVGLLSGSCFRSMGSNREEGATFKEYLARRAIRFGDVKVV